MPHYLPEDRRPFQVFVHSANPVGAKAMLDALRRASIEARRIDPMRLCMIEATS